MQGIVKIVLSTVLALQCAEHSLLAQSQQSPETKLPKAEIIISAPERIHVGESLRVTLQVKNVGKTPFYITKAVQFFDYHGGFEVVVTPPPGGQVRGGAAAGDYFGKLDVSKETQDFILLVPGTMYGGTITAIAVPASVGKYQIVGRRVPPLISEGDRQKLQAELKFPMLFDLVQSAPRFVIVIE